MHRRLGRRVVAVSFVAAWLVIPCLPAAHAAVTGFTIDTFSTPGTATWTVPAGVRSVRILAVGGGGGGASGCDYSGGTFAPFGGGGGAGGVVSDAFAAVSGSVSVTTAAGGSGGGTTTSDQVEYGGGAGGTSTAGSVSATGGQGGVLRCYSSAQATNSAGTGSGGLGAPDASTAGGNGANGVVSDITGTAVTYAGGGGGGSAGAGSGSAGPGAIGGGGGGGSYISSVSRTDGVSGSDGVVIIRSLDPAVVSAPTVTPIGGGATNAPDYATTDLSLSAPLTAATAIAGGSADFMVGGTVIASDTSILATDTTVDATTALGSNAAVQALLPSGTSSVFVRFRTAPMPNGYESDSTATSVVASYVAPPPPPTPAPQTPPPTNVTASVSGTTVTVAWDPPIGNPPISNYAVSATSQDGSPVLIGGSAQLCLVTGADYSCQLTLPAGTYTFAVQAFAPWTWSTTATSPPTTVVPPTPSPTPVASTTQLTPALAPVANTNSTPTKDGKPASASVPAPVPAASGSTVAGTPSPAPSPTSTSPTAIPSTTAIASAGPVASPSPSSVAAAPAPQAVVAADSSGVLPPQQVPPMLSWGPFPVSLSIGPLLAVDLGLAVDTPAAGSSLAVAAEGLKPGSLIETFVYSEPQMVGSSTAAADGTAVVDATIPDGLPPGLHTIRVVGVGPDGERVESIAAFTVDGDGATTGVAPAGRATGTPTDEQLERAVAAKAPVYDVRLSPGAAAAIGLAVTAVPAMAGLARRKSASTDTPTPEPADGPSADSVGDADAGISHSLLDRVAGVEPGAGDRSWSWRLPGTAAVDAGIARAAHWLAARSRILLRVLLDGSWSRAAFGAAGPIVLWGTGLILGVIATVSVGNANVPAPWPLLAVIMAIGLLDAMAGVLAWLVGAAATVVTGHVTSLDSARALLGTLILYTALPLVIAGIRSLRRSGRMTGVFVFDRTADYVMTIVLGALAGIAILRLANALIGVEIAGPDVLWPLQLVFAAAILVRLIGEDVATHVYPARSAAIEPHDLPEPARWSVIGGIVVKVAAFLVLASPFVGVTAASAIAGVALALPMILDLFSDRLPSLAALTWLPQSVYRSLPMVFVGTYVAAGVALLATEGSQPWVYLLLFAPALVMALLDFLGRTGDGWRESWPLRIGGVVAWVALLPFLFGIVSLG